MNQTEFWQRVYIAAVQSGKTYSEVAAKLADDALNEFAERFEEDEEVGT